MVKGRFRRLVFKERSEDLLFNRGPLNISMEEVLYPDRYLTPHTVWNLTLEQPPCLGRNYVCDTWFVEEVGTMTKSKTLRPYLGLRQTISFGNHGH